MIISITKSVHTPLLSFSDTVCCFFPPDCIGAKCWLSYEQQFLRWWGPCRRMPVNKPTCGSTDPWRACRLPTCRGLGCRLPTYTPNLLQVSSIVMAYDPILPKGGPTKGANKGTQPIHCWDSNRHCTRVFEPKQEKVANGRPTLRCPMVPFLLAEPQSCTVLGCRTHDWLVVDEG